MEPTFYQGAVTQRSYLHTQKIRPGVNNVQNTESVTRRDGLIISEISRNKSLESRLTFLLRLGSLGQGPGFYIGLYATSTQPQDEKDRCSGPYVVL